MELTAELIVKVITLITALVGLYKVANIEAAKPFLEQLIGVAAILGIPLYMLVFFWIMTTMQGLMQSNSEPKEIIDPDAPEAVIMYQISRQIWNHDLRQRAYLATIEKAFASKRYDIVLEAAERLHPTTKKDPVLMRAIEALSGKPHNLSGSK